MARKDKLRGAAAIVGVGYAYTEAPKSPLALMIEACRGAIMDAGIDKREVGGIFSQRPPVADLHPQYNNVIANELKIAPTMSSEITIHGAGILASLKYATLAVEAGMTDYVICTTGDSSNILLKDRVSNNAFTEADSQFEAPFGPLTPALYAQIATRHMFEYRTTNEQLAMVAVEHRKWAVKHPHAGMRDKGLIRVEDVLKSRMIASPLHLLDCAVRAKIGTAGALVVTNRKNAKKHKNPLWILGFGECSTHEYISDRMALVGVPPVMKAPSLTTTGAEVAGAQAYNMSGLGPKDIDVWELTAPFTHVVIIVLEDLGLCKKGEGGKFVEQGGIDFDAGGIALDTNGGLLSYGQTGPGCAMDMMIEGLRQIRGQAQGRQVPNAKTALLHANGGIMACESIGIVSSEY